MKIKSPKEFWAGVMFIAFGGFAVVWSLTHYQMGTAVRMGPGDLAQLVERTAEDFSTEKGRLTVRTPSEPVPVECDPVRVVQVLSNLVSNGLKYSGPDAPVSVELKISSSPTPLM